MECVIKTLKYEWFRSVPIIKDFDRLASLWTEFENWYNVWRPHMTLGGFRPDDLYYGRKPETPKRNAKTVPNNIERHVFTKTRVTGRSVHEPDPHLRTERRQPLRLPDPTPQAHGGSRPSSHRLDALDLSGYPPNVGRPSKRLILGLPDPQPPAQIPKLFRATAKSLSLPPSQRTPGRSGYLVDRIQRGTTAQWKVLLWKDPHANVPGSACRWPKRRC
jgi:hypothetical protein